MMMQPSFLMISPVLYKPCCTQHFVRSLAACLRAFAVLVSSFYIIAAGQLKNSWLKGGSKERLTSPGTVMCSTAVL
eukprot:scaffold8182_cov110-Skeletonema_dohrnii-CCMP3373.AAC.2